jgi:hypothetical protein
VESVADRRSRAVYRHDVTARILVGLWLAAAAPALALRPVDAPRLAPPDPEELTIVAVDTAQELADACWNLVSTTAIVIAAGDYDLASVEFPNGVDGRLTVGRYGAPPISNVERRGATGNPADVVLHGAGMLDPIVPFGFQIFTATDGAIERPEGAPPGSCYTNGIDAIGVDGWIVRDNLIRNIRCRNGALAGPALLLWQGSSDTLVERNAFVDCARGVSLGLIDGGDHTGGMVRNHLFRWELTEDPGSAIDVPIYTVSPGSTIVHNTALVAGQYPNAIEVRYASATGVEVRANRSDAAIQARDGASV